MIDDALVAALLDGKVAALARAVSIVENASPGFEQLLETLHPRVGDARRIGITGPPGAGKSTLIDGLVAAFREAGQRVAVIAVDPSSPFTGGALLGDRVRMESVALDRGVYIRSMATRGSLGGLSIATAEVGDVLDAAGFDRIIVETVGVGQSELDVAIMTDVTMLVLVPESGDGIQMLKSGVMEAADVIVVNKADRPGADALRRDIEVALDLRDGMVSRRAAHAGDARAWRPPVLVASARDRQGIPEIVGAFDRQWSWMTADGSLDRRRSARAQARVRAVVARAIDRWVWHGSSAPAILDRELARGRGALASPYRVAAEILASLAWSTGSIVDGFTK